jgi:aminoglycoside/choline kinase family phosphotransferase
MQVLIDAIKNLYTAWKGIEPVSIDVLPISGSERRYFRLHGNERSVIGTYGANVKENESFIYFSQHFHAKGLAVPEIFAVSDDRMYYLQHDFGDVSLLNCLEKDGFTQPVFDLFKKALQLLHHCRSMVTRVWITENV